MAEEVFVTRSAGIGCAGVQDQYADGKAAQVWEMLRKGGEGSEMRTRHYRKFLVELLRRKGCRRILDVACGTGVDSVMLLEEGFDVTSIDASDKMLKIALKKRWARRKEKAFDNWVIEEANWLTLPDDLEDMLAEGGFDALICLGNSFAHLVDMDGDQSKQRQAIANFEYCVKPGGLLVIDHRNFDSMLNSDSLPSESIYYKNVDLTTSVLYTAGKPVVLTLDYKVDLSKFEGDQKTKSRVAEMAGSPDFRLSYYPHKLSDFTAMLMDAFPKGTHNVLADFQSSETIQNPGFYIHVMEKYM